MQIKNNILNIMTNIDIFSHEIGGVLGGNNGVVEFIEVDKNIPVTDRNVYVPNTDYLSKIINNWDEEGIKLYGIFHTHSKGQTDLSKDDIKFIYAFFDMNKDIDAMCFPIIIPNDNIYFYMANRTNNEISVNLEILDII